MNNMTRFANSKYNNYHCYRVDCFNCFIRTDATITDKMCTIVETTHLLSCEDDSGAYMPVIIPQNAFSAGGHFQNPFVWNFPPFFSLTSALINTSPPFSSGLILIK